MRLIVNGMQRDVREGLSVTELLEADAEPIGHVLVEVNGVHIHLRDYGTYSLGDGDRVEIILPAFGG